LMWSTEGLFLRVFGLTKASFQKKMNKFA